MMLKWFNIGVFGLLLTIAGLIWQGGATLTGIKDGLKAEREERRIELSHLKSWLDDTRDRLKALENK